MNTETLEQWCKHNLCKHHQYGKDKQCRYVHWDDAKHSRASLYHLSDYVVSSVQSGAIVLIPR